MRITEALASLESILETEGDLELVSLVCVEDGFMVDEDHTFEVMEMPLREGEPETTVVAFVDSCALSEVSTQ